MLKNNNTGNTKNSMTAALLMGLVFVAWMMWQQSVNEVPKPKIGKAETEENYNPRSDSNKQSVNDENSEKTDNSQKSDETKKSERKAKHGLFSDFAYGEYKVITIENELYTAKISSKGGDLIEFTLKEYYKWDKTTHSQLINNREGQLFLSFRAVDGSLIDTRDLYFSFDENTKEKYTISGKNSINITAKLEVSPGKFIEKVFTFFGDSYDLDCEINLNDMEDYIPRNGYNFSWDGGLAYQEHNSIDESTESQVMVSRYSKLDDFTTDEANGEELSYEGTIDFVAIKLKYFAMAIIPEPYQSYSGTVDVYGYQKTLPNDGHKTIYDVSLRVPYRGGKHTQKFKVYIGPLDYPIIDQYQLGDLISFGWRIGISQISKYVMLPLFKLLYQLIGNWGITLIVFAFIIKLILTPFSMKQMKSTKKMKILQPEIEKLREKYPDDKQAQSRETMKLYSQYGANPASGCLPLLLQMPILFALFSLLRNIIDLRQSSFIWWIHDLSAPDVLVDFGFSIFGIGHLSGLALLMGITMFIQQKMTVTDPRQKAMVYMMPVMFTLMFAYLPAGLNLYYFIFNLLSIAQQFYINKYSSYQPTLADMKKAPKKPGWIANKMAEAQSMSEQQKKNGGSASIQKYGNIDKNNVNYRKRKKK